MNGKTFTPLRAGRVLTLSLIRQGRGDQTTEPYPACLFLFAPSFGGRGRVRGIFKRFLIQLHSTMKTVYTNLIDQAQPLPVQFADDGAAKFTFDAPAGLYQFSVIADASQFNWDELYTVLNDWHGLNNERTGPWDFHLFEQSRPLIPSYWVTINGREIGLWFFARVSIEDIAAKRFRGRMAFHVAQAGAVTVELKPYRPVNISWLSAALERDPEDHLEPLSFSAKTALAKNPAAAWANPKYCPDQKRHELADDACHHSYAKPLGAAFDWIQKRNGYAPQHVLMLSAAYRMNGGAALLEKLWSVLDESIAKPHWGNPKLDGYSHDGDMGAASSLFALAWALQALGPDLDAERREKLIAKLRLQGTRFFHLAMLNRDYWGGSVMQDHGRISLPLFAVASLLLLGVLPDAELWSEYAIPRVRQAVFAMPRDGQIPMSSYGNLGSYLDQQTWFRDVLLPAVRPGFVR